MNKYLGIVGGILLVVVGFVGGFSVNVSQHLGSYVPNPVSPSGVGFSTAYTTSTALTAAQFCNANQLWSGTSALATDTLPAATTTYASCGTTFGVISPAFITNDSTNTVAVVAGTNMSFICETQGVGTSTVIGGCTSSGFSVLATSSVSLSYYWDNSSSSLKVLVGNNNH